MDNWREPLDTFASGMVEFATTSVFQNRLCYRGRKVFMKFVRFFVAFIVTALLAAGGMLCSADQCGPRVCLPERPIPPESIGPIPIPFDLPIVPTLVKTEFHILPWISFGKASICLPYACKPVEFPAPCLSLKPVPFWFPWLRPFDAECSSPQANPIP